MNDVETPEQPPAEPVPDVAALTVSRALPAWKQRLIDEPWAYDFFWTVGRVEALNPGLPRIGDSATRQQEFLDMGQIPYLNFPTANIASFDPGSAHVKPRMRVHFLGFLGPMGPLPTTTTEEALSWFLRRDDAFVRFLDIFNNRFLQLFYRAHADARPAAHMRRPELDRFRHYIGSTIGIAFENWKDMDTMPDYQKLAYAGLLGARGVSASRIRHLIAGIFQIEAETEEFVGSYLDIAPEEQTQLGMAHAGLGTGAVAGKRVLTVDTRFRLSLHVDTLEEYRRFLPGGRWADRLVDALSNAVGFEYDWEVELVLPEDEVRPAQLGTFGALGWTGWVHASDRKSTGGHVRTRFSPIDDDSGRMLN